MQVNWTILIIIGLVLATLLVFVVRRNRKDEKDLNRKLKEDYPKSKNEEGDVDIEDSKSI